MKIKKGDKVVVLTGKDKKKSGVVTRAIPKEDRVVVEGVNVRKLHVKPRSGGKGQTVTRSMPIHVSNVKLAK